MFEIKFPTKKILYKNSLAYKGYLKKLTFEENILFRMPNKLMKFAIFQKFLK